MDRFHEIRLEEKYRTSIRNKLNSPAPAQSSALWTFLNSTFGIFLLSTVFISSFTWLYGQWTGAKTQKHDTQKTWERLQVELSNRIRYFDKLTTRIPSQDYKVIRGALYGFDPAANVNPSWILHYSPVFLEYKERSFSSLLWELATVSNDSKKPKLKSLRETSYSIEACFDKLNYEEIPAKDPKNPQEIYSLSAADLDSCKTHAIDPIKEITRMTYDD